MLIRDILKRQDTFSDNEKLIADYFLNQKEELQKKGVRKIAADVFQAPSSIVRFTQKLGFSGLEDFKEQYLKELSYHSRYFRDIDPNQPFEADDNEIETAGKIAALYQETIQDTLSLLDPRQLKKAVRLLDRETIYIITLSAQRGVSQVFKEKMAKIERRVVILSSDHDALFEIEHADPSAAGFLILSYTGESEHCLRFAAMAKARHFGCVAITSYGINQLSDLISCTLRVSSREKLVSNLGNFSFSLSSLYVLDVIYAEIFRLDYEKTRARKRAASRREGEMRIVSCGRRSSNSTLNE